MDLTAKKCVPHETNTPPLGINKIKEYLKEIPEWLLFGEKIQRQFKFKDFKASMRFVLKVAELAEKEGHHPDINIAYNRVTLTLFTHTISGLSENDFILAAKIDKIN